MLGILEGQSPRDTEEKKERKFSFRKRKEKLEKRLSAKEVLPARCIQVTEVKSETLNPVWDEHFVLWVQHSWRTAHTCASTVLDTESVKHICCSWKVFMKNIIYIICVFSEIDDVHNDLLHLDIWYKYCVAQHLMSQYHCKTCSFTRPEL